MSVLPAILLGISQSAFVPNTESSREADNAAITVVGVISGETCADYTVVYNPLCFMIMPSSLIQIRITVYYIIIRRAMLP